MKNVYCILVLCVIFGGCLPVYNVSSNQQNEELIKVLSDFNKKSKGNTPLVSFKDCDITDAGLVMALEKLEELQRAIPQETFETDQKLNADSETKSKSEFEQSESLFFKALGAAVILGVIMAGFFFIKAQFGKQIIAAKDMAMAIGEKVGRKKAAKAVSGVMEDVTDKEHLHKLARAKTAIFDAEDA